MNKKLMLLYLVFASTCPIFSQVDTKAQVKDWVSEHPEVKLMSSTDYQKLTDHQKLELVSLSNKIIYSSQLTTEDISAFENAVDKLSPRSEVEFVFHWKQSHPEVKIVQRTYFNSLPTEKQVMYLNVDALILMGDELTKKDILLYEHSH